MITYDSKPRRHNLYFAVYSVDLLYISVGCVWSWTSPVIPMLELVGEKASWIGSSLAIGSFLGPLLNALLMDNIGKKWTMFTTGFIFLISWCILISTTNFWVIITGRVIGGIACGVAINIIPTYITDISDVAVRQPVKCLVFFFNGIGQMIIYSVGSLSNYMYLQIAAGIPSIIAILHIAFLPESPYFLLERNKPEKALKALAWFRGRSEDDVQPELNVIKLKIENEHANRKIPMLESIKMIGKKPDIRKALIISITCLCFQVLTGYGTVLAYLHPVVASNGIFKLEPYKIGMIFAGSTMVASLAAPWIVKRFGLKNTLVYCYLLIGISMIPITIYIALDVYQYDFKEYFALPLTFLFIYTILYASGAGFIPRSIISEITPPWARGAVIAIGGSINWSLAFLLLFSLPACQHVYKNSLWIFFLIFSVSAMLGAYAVHMIVPETRRLSLIQINDMMKR